MSNVAALPFSAWPAGRKLAACMFAGVGYVALAFEQMSLMIRETGAGGGLRMDEIKWLLSVVVDVIVQFDRDERGRFISEILYEPRRQRLGRWDEQAAAA